MTRARSILLVAALALPSLALSSTTMAQPPVSPGPPYGPLFEDVTEAAGLVYVQHVPPEPPDCVVGSFACDVDRMTGGAAAADVDGDGFTDLFVTRLDAPDILFRNLGDGRFEDVSVEAGIAAFDSNSNGAAFGDIDNDGDPDLLVTVVGTGTDGINDRNYLFVNDGSGHFTEEATVRNAAVASTNARLTFSATFGDYDRDGWLDLHVTEWLGSAHSRLLRNLGAAAPGHFEDVTEEIGLDFEGVNGFASTFVDLDDDGWPDLAVAGDFLTSRLFWNDGGTFTDGTAAAGVGTDENGMGSTFGDFDRDGDLDWFVTSIYDEDDTCALGNCVWGATGNRLYRNDGDRSFTDATDEAGVREGSWGWGTVFFDLDNDADQDLAMTNGIELLHTDIEDAFNADPMRVWLNDGEGVMRERSAPLGASDTASGKGLLTFDYDRDGDLDLFIVNNAGEPRLYQNRLRSRRSWLRLRIRGHESNRDGVGARVSVWRRPGAPPQVREVGVASHYLGQSEPELHFGLGRGVHFVHRVRVEFPASGRVADHFWLRANRLHTLDERDPGCGTLGAEAIVFPLVALLPALSHRRRRARQARPGA